MEARNELKGGWKKFKGRIKQNWGKLTGNNLDRAEGNLSEIVGEIEKNTARPKIKSGRELKKLKID